jgi:biotin transporter BioY
VKRFQGASAHRLALATSLAALTGFLAQVSFRVGPVPYTVQNVAVVLAGLLLPPRWAAASQLTYLLMVALGLPAASGFRGGVVVLVGYTGGYLAGFPVASALTSYLSRTYLRLTGRRLSTAGFRDVVVLLLLSAIAVAPVYLLGFAVTSSVARLAVAGAVDLVLQYDYSLRATSLAMLSSLVAGYASPAALVRTLGRLSPDLAVAPAVSLKLLRDYPRL